jgi:Lrp/AsnC family leucine-responsive transcriptional regulator
MYKDKVDERIIGYLKEDSRKSFVDIGKKLKLSESAVRRRVKNLVDSKTIDKFTIELGEDNVTSAIVLVSVDSATDTSKVSLKLAKLNGVKTVYEITGQYDITTIMSASSIAEINSSIDEKLQG